MKLFNNIYKNKKVLVTGHTGFKGSWLVKWLQMLGADVIGLSLDIVSIPTHYEILNLNIKSITGDIRNKDIVAKIIEENKPEIVFHLAAQSLVKQSYIDPIGTLETNIIGTANVFEACRKSNIVKAIINITSDKCYENKEWEWAYRENEQMGGHDPYSVSKGASELITNSYRNSFFNLDDYGKEHNILLASLRAGNVIGGGDWAENRLVPDIMKSASKKQTVIIRSPNSVRPWQHVLEPLSAYLLIGQKLIEGNKEFAQAWNVGSINNNFTTVKELLDKLQNEWMDVKYEIQNDNKNVHEANLLKLDCSKINHRLKWKNIWDIEQTVKITTEWYKEFYQRNNIETERNITKYIKDAEDVKAVWIK